jgi:hypothetical protein
MSEPSAQSGPDLADGVPLERHDQSGRERAPRPAAIRAGLGNQHRDSSEFVSFAFILTGAPGARKFTVAESQAARLDLWT